MMDNGLKIGDRVCEDGSENGAEGVIQTICADDGTATVEWDTGHTSFDTDIDVLMPVEGW